jgi:hypothetical protein
MAESPVQTARERLLQAVQSGDWERVPAEADAYAAAVRADERRRVVSEALDAVRAVFGDDPDPETAPAAWRDRCLTAVQGLF